MDSREAEGMRFTMNLVTPDNGEKFIVELDNATLTNIKGFQAEKPDLTPHDKPLRPGADDDARNDARSADRGWDGQGTRRRRVLLQQLAATMVDLTRALRSCPGRSSGRTWWRMRTRTRRCRAKPSRNRIAYSSPWREKRCPVEFPLSQPCRSA